MDSETLGCCLIEEGNFVGNIHSNWISNKGFAALNIPDNERVVILATE